MMDDLLSAAECGLPSCPIKFELASHYQNSNPQIPTAMAEFYTTKTASHPKMGLDTKCGGMV